VGPYRLVAFANGVDADCVVESHDGDYCSDENFDANCYSVIEMQMLSMWVVTLDRNLLNDARNERVETVTS